MAKLKHYGRMILSVILAILLMAGAALCTTASAPMPAAAYTEEAVPFSDGEVSEKTSDEAIHNFVEGFVAKLRAKYGEEYESYLNDILAEWGSVEDYLLSLAGDRTDPASNGWRKFVSWLGENAAVWAPALAIALVIAGILLARSVVRKYWDKQKKIFTVGMNKLFEAQIAQGRALEKLLGEGAKTEGERAALKASTKKLEEVDEDA